MSDVETPTNKNSRKNKLRTSKMYLLRSDISVILFFKIKVHEWKQDENKECSQAV